MEVSPGRPSYLHLFKTERSGRWGEEKHEMRDKLEPVHTSSFFLPPCFSFLMTTMMMRRKEEQGKGAGG
jgi:hypothetical protein